jgi:hypothetical protein
MHTEMLKCTFITSWYERQWKIQWNNGAFYGDDDLFTEEVICNFE